MRIKAIIALAGLSLSATACQSLPIPSPATAAPLAGERAVLEPTTSLGPQRLDSGECGVFLWRAGGPHDLLAFENLTRGEIRFLVDAEALRRVSPGLAGMIAVGDLYERRFPGAGNVREILVSGRFDEVVADGLRMNRAVLRLEGVDGSRRVIPVLGHYSCRRD
ncbi:hypothetical protein [Maricaulis salignorans]|uniref:hypothetical protein n=1 Tax=Maricaulis salignorans TaxID=144026 RepID=UPI003A907497